MLYNTSRPALAMKLLKCGLWVNKIYLFDDNVKYEDFLFYSKKPKTNAIKKKKKQFQLVFKS